MPSVKYPQLNDPEWVKEQEQVHGGMRPAARANGISYSTWQYHSSEKYRERALERALEYQQTEKYREYTRKRDQLRRSDPDYRRRFTLYMIDYRHRRKRERWANHGLTLGDHDKEGGSSRTGVAA